MKREIKSTEWLRYERPDGERFWWHPDDKPPAEGSLLTIDGPDPEDWTVSTMLRVRLDPPVDLYGCRFDELTVIWSEKQCCNFLLAHGIDSEGNQIEQRLSTNLSPQYTTANGYFYCREDDHIAQVIAELKSRKILEPTGKHAESGFLAIPLFRFTPIEYAQPINS